MSSFSGSNPTPPLTNPASEILQLYSVVLGDELEIEGEGGDSLQITSKISRNGIPEKHTRHLDLKREAVLLYYTIGTNQDVSKLWNVGIVYGSGSTRKTVEYPLQSEQDAFRFQRLVTGYSPHRRFKPVAASALEQHLAPGKQATEFNFTGEAQLWYIAQPKSRDTLISPPQATRDGSSAGGRFQSISSRTSTLSGASILRDDKGRDVAVTKAKAPPLLVLFAKSEETNDEVPFQMMRVNITDLEYRDVPRNPRRLKLINSKRKRKVEIYTRVAQGGSWNLCHLRPVVFSKYFKRHRCDELTLDFADEQDVAHFKEGVLRLRSHVHGISLALPPVSSRSSSSGAAMLGARPVVPNHSLGLDDDGRSRGFTVNDEMEEE